MSFKNHQYSCPHCKQLIASGQLNSYFLVCPQCMCWIHYDKENNAMVQSYPPATLKDNKTLAKMLKRNPSQTYGHDKLRIDQMTNNREECLKKGHSHYFNGKPCRHGHVAPRNKKGYCNECNRINGKKHYKKITQNRKEINNG